jgi:hypothetical protein
MFAFAKGNWIDFTLKKNQRILAVLERCLTLNEHILKILYTIPNTSSLKIFILFSVDRYGLCNKITLLNREKHN